MFSKGLLILTIALAVTLIELADIDILNLNPRLRFDFFENEISNQRFCNSYKIKQWVVTTAATNNDIINILKNYKNWNQWCILIVEIPQQNTITQLINKQIQSQKCENNSAIKNNGNDNHDNIENIDKNVKFFNQTMNETYTHFIFLSIYDQMNKLNYEISKYLYSLEFLQIYQLNPNEMLFKNIGYMFAIKHHAFIIFDTDRFHFVKGLCFFFDVFPILFRIVFFFVMKFMFEKHLDM